MRSLLVVWYLYLAYPVVEIRRKYNKFNQKILKINNLTSHLDLTQLDFGAVIANVEFSLLGISVL